MSGPSAVAAPRWLARPGAAWRAAGAIAANRAIVRLQGAYLAAFLASSMLAVGLAVVAFVDGGPSAVSALVLAQMLPAVLIVPAVAGVGDRLPRQRVLSGTLAVCAVATAALALNDLARGPMLVVYLLAPIIATAAGVAWAVVGALLPMLAHGPDELVGANVASTTTEGVGALAGPLAAAVLLAQGGPATFMVAASAGFLVAFLLSRGVRPPPALAPSLVVGRASGAGRLMAEVTAGARTLLRLPGPRLVSTGMLMQSMVRGALMVLLVVLAVDELGMGEPGVGLLAAAMGLGGLAGSGLAMGIAAGRPLGTVFGLSLLCWGLPIAVLASAPSALVALALLVVVGVGSATTDVAGFGLLQGSVPDGARAGAMGAIEGLVALGLALGSLAASILLAVVDVRVAALLVGLAVPMLVLVRWRAMGRLDEGMLVSRDQVMALQRCALFAPLSLAQLEQLAAGTCTVSFPTDAVIIREGEPGDAFYLLLEGQVRVTRQGATINTLVAGDSFGEIALLRGVPRTATVIAVDPVRAHRVDAATFVNALAGDARCSAAAESVVRRHLGSDAALRPPG